MKINKSNNGLKGKILVFTIDFALIVLSLGILLFTYDYYTPLVISPLEEQQNSSVLFSFDKSSLILIDENPDFSSPIEVFLKEKSIVLEPGTYFWRIENSLDREVRKFTILSRVELGVQEINGNYSVVNLGNTRLNVEVFNETSKLTDLSLEVYNSTSSSGNKFFGRQYE